MKPIVKGLLIGCGGLAVLGMIAVVAGILWLASGPESGVKLGHAMDDYATAYLDEHGMLEPGEEVLAYYDVTLSMDGTEAALVTDRRVGYHVQGETYWLPLAEIETIDHRYESLIGDVIFVQTVEGDALEIEIAPLNGGSTFLNVLRKAAERAGEGAAGS